MINLAASSIAKFTDGFASALLAQVISSMQMCGSTSHYLAYHTRPCLPSIPLSAEPRPSKHKGTSPRLPRLGRGAGSSASSAGGAHSYAAVKAALEQEHEARRVLLLLQRRMQIAEHEQIKEINRARKYARGVAVRVDMDRRVGRDLIQRIQSVTPASQVRLSSPPPPLSPPTSLCPLPLPPASQEELAELAELFHHSLDGRAWFVLFKAVDDDGSGRISYAELKRGCRSFLSLDSRALPDARLHSLWRTLDADESGFVSTGEFGHFMKLGKKTAEKREALSRPPAVNEGKPPRSSRCVLSAPECLCSRCFCSRCPNPATSLPHR